MKQAVKETLQCMECGKLFKRVIPKSLEVKCPKCGSLPYRKIPYFLGNSLNFREKISIGGPPSKNFINTLTYINSYAIRYIMKVLQHYLNSLHLYCFFRKIGFSKQIAMIMAKTCSIDKLLYR